VSATDTQVPNQLDQGRLLGIGQAASRLGVSERTLRYYQQLGLITPSARTPGGLRRYSQADLDRIGRLRELQALLGLNLDEIRVVFGNDDRLAAIREEYLAAEADAERRQRLVAEAVSLQEALRNTVEAKLSNLERFKADLDARLARMHELRADTVQPSPQIRGD
jgi:DNA-binding transcriptional MerR regulator